MILLVLLVFHVGVFPPSLALTLMLLEQVQQGLRAPDEELVVEFVIDIAHVVTGGGHTRVFLQEAVKLEERGSEARASNEGGRERGTTQR